MEFSLCFQYYDSGNLERQQEIDYVLMENLKLPFNNYFIFIDPDLEFPSNDCRITYISLEGRLKFSDFLELVNSIPDQFFVLINSDIRLDYSIFKAKSYLQVNMMFALTRYEGNGELAYADNPRISQDTWMIISQNIPETLIEQTNIKLGIPGCENRFAAIFAAYGFEVWNPCLDVKTCHYHQSAYRTTKSYDRYWGLYLEPSPCMLEDTTFGVSNKNLLRFFKITG
ncbi:hypothetical protein [Synechococcus elongatus]|uniref:hypothetical protein n=1 Tax=Synechococcus elongatus TaxID=32046 RepID=UPI0030CB7BFA